MVGAFKGVAFLAALVSPAQGSLAQQQQPPQAAAWVNDVRFSAVFDMYWRAREMHTYAGNRLCALPQRFDYEDPRSPFRPINQRLVAAANRIEARWPTALNRVRRPYQVPPPTGGLCDDARAAEEALFGFETAVTAVERLLDQLEREDQIVNRAGGTPR